MHPCTSAFLVPVAYTCTSLCLSHLQTWPCCCDASHLLHELFTKGRRSIQNNVITVKISFASTFTSHILTPAWGSPDRMVDKRHAIQSSTMVLNNSRIHKKITVKKMMSQARIRELQRLKLNTPCFSHLCTAISLHKTCTSAGPSMCFRQKVMSHLQRGAAGTYF